MHTAQQIIHIYSSYYYYYILSYHLLIKSTKQDILHACDYSQLAYKVCNQGIICMHACHSCMDTNCVIVVVNHFIISQKMITGSINHCDSFYPQTTLLLISSNFVRTTKILLFTFCFRSDELKLVDVEVTCRDIKGCMLYFQTVFLYSWFSFYLFTKFNRKVFQLFNYYVLFTKIIVTYQNYILRCGSSRHKQGMSLVDEARKQRQHLQGSALAHFSPCLFHKWGLQAEMIHDSCQQHSITFHTTNVRL